MKITCIGSGAFGVAVATLLSKKESNQVSLWTHDPLWQKENTILNVRIDTDLESLVQEADVIFILVSTLFLEEVITKLQIMSLKKKIVFLGSKGMYYKKPYFYTDLFKKKCNAKYVGFFSGPNLANDLLKDTFCSITFSMKDSGIKRKIQEIIPENVILHFVKTANILELASTLKNIYAIGAGIIEEQTSSLSFLHTYLSYCYDELLTILYKTFVIDSFPLDITGDFYLTGTMKESRNRKFGIALAKGKGSSFLKKNTVEGKNNLSYVINYFKKNRIKAPMIFALYNVIILEKNVDIIKETINK